MSKHKLSKPYNSSDTIWCFQRNYLKFKFIFSQVLTNELYLYIYIYILNNHKLLVLSLIAIYLLVKQYLNSILHYHLSLVKAQSKIESEHVFSFFFILKLQIKILFWTNHTIISWVSQLFKVVNCFLRGSSINTYLLFHF